MSCVKCLACICHTIPMKDLFLSVLGMSPGLFTPESPLDVLLFASTMVDQTEAQLRESCSPTSTTPPEKLKSQKQKYYKGKIGGINTIVFGWIRLILQSDGS